MALSYDLHVHPGPSAQPRWGTGSDVWQAARAAGVRGFVWKSHEQHTQALCLTLPDRPVRPIGSASLNPWASQQDVTTALEDGASWLWGPTQTAAGRIGWDLELPDYWPALSEWLAERSVPVVLATGHLDASGRAAFARLAQRHEHLLCSITHSLFVPLDELLGLAEQGCAFEFDAYTLSIEVPGRRRGAVEEVIPALRTRKAIVYFTSDGGQVSTGDPFQFGAAALDRIRPLLGPDVVVDVGTRNPAAIVAWLDERLGR